MSFVIHHEPFSTIPVFMLVSRLLGSPQVAAIDGGWQEPPRDQRAGTFSLSPDPREGKRRWKLSSVTKANDLIGHACLMKPP